MADMEKVYCMERPDNSQLLAELINAKGSDCNQAMWMNNPFMYLIWLAFFGGGNGFGFNRGAATELQGSELMARLNSIERQAQDNHNNTLAFNAITGNGKAITELAGNLNVGVASLDAAIDRIQATIGRVAGEVGLSSERVINAIGSGNLNMIQQFKDCCCSTQKEIIKMGYDNQISNLNQTNQLQERLTNIANGLTQGFSSTAYETQRQTCDIINANNNNTQKILDTLNGHWSLETSQKLQDAKFEISQLKQTQYLVDTLKTTS